MMMEAQNETARETGFRRTSALSPVANAWRIVFAALVIPILQQFENLDWQLWDDLINFRIWDQEKHEPTAIATIVGIFLLVLILGTVLTSWTWAFTKYRITPKTVYYNTGLFWRKKRQVPVDRIQSVEVHRPLQAQVFGLATLHIESAGGQDSAVSLQFLRRAEAEALADLLRTYVKGALTLVSTVTPTPTPVQSSSPAANTFDLSAQSVPVSPPPSSIPVAAIDQTLIPIAKVSNTRLLIGGIFSSKLLKALSGVLIVWVIILIGWYAASSTGFGLFQFAFLLFGAGLTFLNLIIEDWRGETVIKGKNLQISGGLTNKVTQSTPISRIHGVIIEQSLIWALFDWWNGQITVAGRQLASDEKKHSTKDKSAVVAGGPQDVQRLVWATLPDLGTDQADKLIREGMYGMRNTGDWLKPLACSWFRQPFSWFRLGLMVTEKAVLLRSGLIERKFTVFPLTHVQQIVLKQGPINRLCGTGVLTIRGVHGSRVSELRIRGISFPQALVVERYLETVVKANLRPLGQKPLATQRELEMTAH